MRGQQSTIPGDCFYRVGHTLIDSGMLTPTVLHHALFMSPGGVWLRQTIYVKMAEGKTVADAKAALEAAYEGEKFVTVLPGSAVPHTRHVRGRRVKLPS